MRYIGSVLDLAILGLLGDGPLHGYEIRRRLRTQLGSLSSVSFGSLYPALARLERAGDVVVVDAEPVASAPATGSLSGERASQRSMRLVSGRGRRGRKAYLITDQGRQTFSALLNASPQGDDSRSFGLRWSFARYLTPGARLSLLERRRGLLITRLDDAAETAELDDYARSVVEHAKESLRRDVAWLDQLIAAEQSRITSETEVATNVTTENTPA
jgi:DNA-binding PadR family transcriptional regulator